jgi:glycosyltransferase involved in cell wall biosynthesis
VTLSTVAFEQLCGLRDRGWDVRVACHFDGWEQRLRDEGFPLLAIGLAHRGSAASMLRAAPVLLEEIRRRGVALVHTHNAHHGVLGRIVARVAGVPAVHTWRYHPLDATGSRALRVCFGAAEAVAARAGSAVLFLNEEDMEEAVRLRIVPASQARLIRNGIRIERYRTPLVAPAEVRRTLGVAPDAELVACIARLHERKRQADLLEAAAMLARRRPRLRVLVVGSGPDESALRAQVDRLGLGEVVTFTGHREDVRDILHASDLVCLPSRREGAPRALLEAMAAGRPIVATDVAGTRAVVERDRTGLLVPFADPVALAGAIAEVLDSPRLALRLGANGPDAVKRGGWEEEAVTDRVAGIYREILGAATPA